MAKAAWSDPDAFTLVAPKAFSLPANLRKRAESAARIHTRVGDWIDAAPMIAVGYEERHAQGLYELALARGKAIDAMRIVGVPTPMRRMTGLQAARWIKRRHWREPFLALPESELSQMLAKMTEIDFDLWCARLSWGRTMGVPRSTDPARWLLWRARNSVPSTLDGYRFALDLIYSGEPFNLSWSLARFTREHHAWIERRRTMREADRDAQMAARLAGREASEARRLATLDKVTPYGEAPTTGTYGLVEYRALQTPRQLMSEGSAMRHCVGGVQFVTALLKRRARYYHLHAGAFTSTLEILRAGGGRWILGQHYGPCNARPHDILKDAAIVLVAANNAPTPTGAPTDE